MFKSLYTYLPESLDQFLFGRYRSSNRSSLPPRPSAQRPQLPISRIDTIPTEILQEIFLFVVSSSLSDHRPCPVCHLRRSGSQILLTHPPSMILSHVCKRWREIMLEYPLLWSFISDQDLYCEEWMKTLLSRLWRVNPHSRPLSLPRNDSDDTPLLTIRLRFCSRQSHNQIARQLDLLRISVQRSPWGIRDLSVDIPDIEMFELLFGGWVSDGMMKEVDEWGRRKVHPKWTKNLEGLHISTGIDCGGVNEIENWVVDIKKEEEYVSYLTFRHTPTLLFMSHVLLTPVSIFDDDDTAKKPESEHRLPVSHLRKLSLTNCFLPLQQLLHLKNIEELTVIYANPMSGPGFLYWTRAVHCLPRLRRLSIDGVVVWCPKGFDPGVPPSPIETRKKRSTDLEELCVNRCSPLWAAGILHFFIDSSGDVDDQRQQKKWLRKLQITCTDVMYDEEFRKLCEAIRAWFNSWNSWTYEGGGGYLYLSIQPNGIIVHNRQVNIMESTESNRETETATNEEEPEIHLTLYSRSTLSLDLISDVLNLVSSSPNKFDATAGPFTLSCEELELSVGLLDIEDDRFGRVLKSLLETFGKVKRLKRLRCVGSTTARVLSTRESGGLTLLPMLKRACFDHVDFSDLDQLTWMMSNPPNCVEFIKCLNVRRDWVSKLQRVGTDVLLGQGTRIVEGSEGSKKVEKERWTSEKVKVLMNKWAAEARSN